jgi:hypothetical protein
MKGNMNLSRLICIFLLSVGMATAATAASVRVELSSRSISDDDDLQVTFTFEGQGQGELPNLDGDWQTVGSSQQISTNFVNGRMYRNRSQTLVLRPKRQGKLTIGTAKLIQAGQVIAQSTPTQVIVRGLQPLIPSQALKERNIAAGPFLLVPQISRDIQYVGEPFVVEYVLLIEDGQRVTDFGLRDVEYPGAIQREAAMEERFERVGTRTLFGKRYAEAIVFREVWKVLQPEVVTAPSQKLVIEVGGRSFRRNRQTVKAPPLKLDVRPVPTVGRPSTYREGAIGKFSVAASLDADDARGRAVLAVVVSGTGSLRTLDPPALSVKGATVQSLPNDGDDKVVPGKDGVTGEVQFQYLLTPERIGTVFIQPVSLTYFDPASASFATTRSEPLTWNAKTAGPQRVTRPVRSDEPMAQQQTRTFQPIERDRALSMGTHSTLPEEDWFPYIILIPVLLFCGVEATLFARRLASSDSVRSRKRRASATAQKSLMHIEAQLGKVSTAEMYGQIGTALHGYLNDKHDVVTAGSSKHRLNSVLTELGYDGELAVLLMTELEACDAARFSPSAAGETECKAALARARELIDRLEGQK